MPERAPRTTALAVSLVTLVVAVAASLVPDASGRRAIAREAAGGDPPPWRTFTSSSYWNKPLPADAPEDPASREIIDWLHDNSKIGDRIHPYLRLAGTSPSGHWGIPIFLGHADDPVQPIIDDCRHPDPPQLARVHVPTNAAPDPTSDAELVIVDFVTGRQYGLWLAYRKNGILHSCWTSVYYNASNGISGEFYPHESNEEQNWGYRGVPPYVYGVRRGEIVYGEIPHVLKITTSGTCNHYFPMNDHAPCSSSSAPAQGTLIRIRPEVDLSDFSLSPAARIIARAIQKYGALIGERSGGTTNLKVENCVVEHGTQCWKSVLRAKSLRSIPFLPRYWEVVKLGYRCTVHCGKNP
jgi:hypothetical protein